MKVKNGPQTDFAAELEKIFHAKTKTVLGICSIPLSSINKVKQELYHTDVDVGLLYPCLLKIRLHDSFKCLQYLDSDSNVVIFGKPMHSQVPLTMWQAVEMRSESFKSMQWEIRLECLIILSQRNVLIVNGSLQPL